MMWKIKRYPGRLILLVVLVLTGCQTTYYNAWEKLGVHKRDILVDRIEEAQEAQEETQEEFRDALESYRAVVSFDGGDLENLYNRLKRSFDDSEAAANNIADRVKSVEKVAEALFDEWQTELEMIKDARLRRDSASKLKDTRRQYQQVIAAMRRAEKSVHPVLDTLRDQVLYLKHNLNARAIASLKGELKTIGNDVNRLIGEMQKSIDEASRFVQQMQK